MHLVSLDMMQQNILQLVHEAPFCYDPCQLPFYDLLLYDIMIVHAQIIARTDTTSTTLHASLMMLLGGVDKIVLLTFQNWWSCM
mmetsp:Transcript_80954/g.142778  ORF Transcript_80954/g.142778 Transcript_80954/m.142778 type:complete len:84 (+) Transcript_80954:953-1204(+)